MASVPYVLDKHAVHTLSSKTDTIIPIPTPSLLFLGDAELFMAYLSPIYIASVILNLLLKNDRKWVWTSQCEKAFQESKPSLTSAPVLTNYDPVLLLSIAADASTCRSCNISCISMKEQYHLLPAHYPQVNTIMPKLKKRNSY